MRNVYATVVTLSLLTFAPFQMSGAEAPQSRPVKKPLSPIASTAASSAIYVYVEILQEQPVENGLRADVVFVNRSDEPVTIADPVYFTTLTIVDADGTVLTYPNPAAHELQAKGERPARVITIAPRQDHRLTVVVTEVYPPQKTAVTRDGAISARGEAREPVRIMPGKYRVAAMTALTSPENLDQDQAIHLRSEAMLVLLDGGAQ
ncbi:MAG TPA: hypothetical protein VF618_00170 [Thermoanaerobaculia bacterium]